MAENQTSSEFLRDAVWKMVRETAAEVKAVTSGQIAATEKQTAFNRAICDRIGNAETGIKELRDSKGGFWHAAFRLVPVGVALSSLLIVGGMNTRSERNERDNTRQDIELRELRETSKEQLHILRAIARAEGIDLEMVGEEK